MSYETESYEEERLQRKLIPVNVVVAVLALVAIISLLVAPLLTIDMNKMGRAMAEISSSSEGGNGEGGAQVQEVFGSLDGTLTVSAFGLAKLATAKEEEKVNIIIDKLFIDTGMIENIAVKSMNQAFVEAADIPQDREIDYAALETSFKKLGTAQSRADFDAAITEYISVLEAQGNVTLEEEVKNNITEEFGKMYDNAVEKAGAENFSFEVFVCATMERAETEDGHAVSINNYRDLVLTFTNQAGNEGGSTPQSFSVFATMIGSGFFLILFCAGVWLVLLVFAIVRIFTPNKRFMMWYAKLFGATPCLLFGVIPLMLSSALKEASTAAAMIFSAVSSLTWISGACYLAMWLVSICWAFPIKHKIRVLRKG